MAGHNFGFLGGEPTLFYEDRRLDRRRESEVDTYRGPNPHTLGEAVGGLMWAFDGIRCTVEARIDTYRHEPPELRRMDGVLIWFVSSVLTAASLLGGLHFLG